MTNMVYDFNAKDVFDMAIRIEQNGAKFYRDAADSVDDQAHKDLLLELAGMEDDHEQTFKEMESDLTKSEKQPTAFDPDDMAGQYLKSLADHRVFFEKELDFSSMRAILKDAIAAEKDSIVFYTGMKETVPGEKGKERIDKIIKEEMGHITRLTRELKQVAKS
jgi:rubrerythrin